MKSYRKFFYLFAGALFVIFSIILSINYIHMEKFKKKILEIQANNLVVFIESMSEVYQKNFNKYHIPINNKTIHLLPIVAIREITQIFNKKVNGDVEIQLISDIPRNIKNKASLVDTKVLNKLKVHHNPIIQIENDEIVYYKPLYISNNCLKCHDTKDKSPKYIRENYDNAYGYKKDELRGAIKIIIKNSVFIELLHRSFLVRLISGILIYIIVLLIVFVLLRKLENLDKKYISELLITNEKLEKARQKAEQATKVKSEFLANMSHEIRTPLNAMFGFIKLLENKISDKEGKKYLHIVKRSGELLLSIINDILDFSKIESGKLNLEYIPFNLDKEIDIIYQLFKNEALKKDITLHVKKENINKMVISDPTRLKQIISNILSNAIKFTPEGKNIYFNIKYDEHKEELYIEVIDEGIGIPKEKLKNIFESFSQVDSSITRKYGGTGLGLTISSNLVKLLGGKLGVDSKEGEGTKFFLTIPMKTTEQQEKKVEEVNTNKNNILYNYHVLFAEDNSANQMFMKIVLEKLGITFDIANDGLEAVELYKKNYDKYDFILMDENMPNMSGSEATIKIREFEKDNNLKSIFIVGLTANTVSEDKNEFLDIGMNSYLLKPLDINKLKIILNKIKG